MPPKKARFGNGGKRGGKGGKGDRGHGGRDSWRDDYRDRDYRPSWRDDREMATITMTIGEIAAVPVKADPPGIQEDETRGAMAPPYQTHVNAIGL